MRLADLDPSLRQKALVLGVGPGGPAMRALLGQMARLQKGVLSQDRGPGWQLRASELYSWAGLPWALEGQLTR